jgi:hypothetical protein
MTPIANFTLNKVAHQPTVRANAVRFTSHTLPQTVVGTSQNGVNLSLKDVPRVKDALRSSSSGKIPEPALPSNKEPAV